MEEGQPRTALVADVAPLIPVARTYSFIVPDDMVASLAIGRRVEVPMGRKGRHVAGFVVGLDERAWDSTLRPIASVVDSASYLTPELVDLGKDIAEHYACPLARTLKAMVPEAVRRQAGFKTVRYARLAGTLADLLADHGRIGSKQKALLEALSASQDAVAVPGLLEQTDASTTTLRGLSDRGWVEITQRKEIIESGEDPDGPPLEEPSFELNDEQSEALAAISGKIDAGGFCVSLLFGVSGSGKTEVYVRAIRRVVAAGRQAIMLVPEIVLTTQLVQRLTSRFADVAVNHSGLSDVQRSLMWRRIAAGEKTVVIGTRSAVFAPCPNLGLIVVDEEQETSFKNLQAPRFNVRDVAIMRGMQLGIPVVLGSATPSIEVWDRSERHRDYQRLALTRRVRDLPMPEVFVVDMRDEHAERKQATIVSRSMERMLTETLQRGEQAVILMNRRGFANRLYCAECKTRIECPNCNAGFVVHTAVGHSKCHYCLTRVPTPTVCPNVTCGAPLTRLGLGTQRVEDVVRMLFPDAVTERVDSDTMTHRDEYERIVADFEAKRIDILVGTQMIAKGLDFPFVSFVGVVNADPTALASDFRAQERLFQLITQVAGRAGRADRPGRVVVQTTMPELPALKFALTHDYESFAAQELEIRRRVALPPYRRLARIVLSHSREEHVRREARGLSERISQCIETEAIEHADVLGPNPCAMSRVRGKYRYELILRTATAADLRKLLRALDTSGALRTKAESLVIDVDPVSMT